jgi:hypothetical protein
MIRARRRFLHRAVACCGAGAVRKKARRVAEKEAEFIDHPADLALLFVINSEILTATEEFAKFIGNVVRFHHGEPYWEEVRWDRWATRGTGDAIKIDLRKGMA